MYSKIFKEIVEVMHHDYAGYIDKIGWDRPNDYKKRIRNLERNNALNTTLFSEIVNDYLLDFQDPHVYLKVSTDKTNQEYQIGFNVRRYANRLFVTNVTREKRLQVGDELISVDYIPIDVLVHKHRRDLREDGAEREDWRPILKKYYQCEVKTADGFTFSMEFNQYEKKLHTPPYKIEKYNDSTLLLTFTDFKDPDGIKKLLNHYMEDLIQYENWIIDIRTNYGGSDVAFHSIIPYLFPEGENQIDLSEKYAMKFNCTEKNYERIKQSFEKELQTVKDEKAKQSLANYLYQWEENKGKGFVAFNSNVSKIIEGKKMPKQVAVLIDRYCSSSGEVFADICKHSDKVTLIGRPTYGINGYGNITCAVWNNRFELYYPTSRLNSMDKGKTLLDVAVHPDVYLPWTPEHLERDVDLLEAEKQLSSK